MKREGLGEGQSETIGTIGSGWNDWLNVRLQELVPGMLPGSIPRQKRYPHTINSQLHAEV